MIDHPKYYTVYIQMVVYNLSETAISFCFLLQIFKTKITITLNITKMKGNPLQENIIITIEKSKMM